MVLPPSSLTRFFYEANEPEEMYERLRQERCLSRPGLEQKSKVIQFIRVTLEDSRSRRDDGRILMGPSAVDELVKILLNSDYLNS
jgi:hypothetical protein